MAQLGRAHRGRAQRVWPLMCMAEQPRLDPVWKKGHVWIQHGRTAMSGSSMEVYLAGSGAPFGSSVAGDSRGG
eukprot:364365-Chlamydomonas_euryale.AAC.10